MIVPKIKIDFHSHILPCMDDGSDSLKTSVGQLEMLKKQGIRQVVATPHFYRHNEDIAAFLSRRTEKAMLLKEHITGNTLDVPEVFLGAEVNIERELLGDPLLEKLKLSGTDYMLVEIPYTGYHDWMAEELYNICYKHKVKPVLAHLDRYIEMLSDYQLQELLSLEDLVIQINNTAFEYRTGIKFVLKLIKMGFPIVFGSDTHNLTSRAPNFNLSNKVLLSKLKVDRFSEIIQVQSNILSGNL